MMNDTIDSSCFSPIYGYCLEVVKHDVDVWNHANNVCYVQWMQDIAVKHSEVLGWNAERYLSSGAIWVVRSHTINYCQSTYQGDKLLVQTWIAEMKKASCLRRYRFLKLPSDCSEAEIASSCGFCPFDKFTFPKNMLVATAETHWAFVSSTSLRPVKVFEELLDVFKEGMNGTATYPLRSSDS